MFSRTSFKHISNFKVVTKVEGIPRSEGDVRKKWTYLKWEAKNTSKPGRDPVSKQVLNILTSRDREVQEAMSLRNMDFPEDGEWFFRFATKVCGGHGISPPTSLSVCGISSNVSFLLKPCFILS